MDAQGTAPTHYRSTPFLTLAALGEVEKIVLSDINRICSDDPIPGAYPTGLKVEIRQYRFVDKQRSVRIQYEMQYSFSIAYGAGVKPLAHLPPTGPVIVRNPGDGYP